MKRDIDEIKAAYETTGNIWKAGKLLGISGQTVHRRLQAISYHFRHRNFTAEEKEIIRRVYTNATYRDDINLAQLATDMGKTREGICIQARQMGLTTSTRKISIDAHSKLEAGKLSAFATNGHPKGMLGKFHTPDALRKIAAASKNTWAAYPPEVREGFAARGSILGRRTGGQNRKGATWKAGWRVIGGVRKYYRSRWEANYARYLEWLRERGDILRWEHEPETFWFDGIKRGCMSYLPDFRVTEKNGTTAYHEVKGWMDARSKTAIARMSRYHPNITLIIIDKPVYTKLRNQLSRIIIGWEE